MKENDMFFAVFVKPWKSLSLSELAKHIRKLGFGWIELPVRPGFLCEPEAIEKSLPEIVRVLGEEGVRVLNITASLPLSDERLYCGRLKAGIQTNLKLCMRLLSEAKINVDSLTTHRIKLVDAEKEIDLALANPDGILGVIFMP